MAENEAVAEAGKTLVADVFPDFKEGQAFPSLLEPLEPAGTPETKSEPVKSEPIKEEVPKKEEKPSTDLFAEPKKPATEPESEILTPGVEAGEQTLEQREAFYKKYGINGAKARENFEKITGVAETLEKKTVELEKSLADEKKLREAGDPNAAAKIRELETKLQELSPLVEQTNLQRHPNFIATFTQPRAKLLEMAQKTVKDFGGDPAVLEKALSLNGRARSEALDEIYSEVTSTSEREELAGMVRNIKMLDQGASDAIQNAKLHNEKLAEQERLQNFQTHEKRVENVKGNLALAEKFLRDEHNFEILKDTTDPELKKTQDQIRSTAERLMLQTEDPAELSAAAYMAASCGVYRNIAKGQLEKIKSLEARLKDYEESEPTLNGDRPNASKTDDEHDDQEDFVGNLMKSLPKGQILPG